MKNKNFLIKNGDGSEIKFAISKFPAGEVGLSLDPIYKTSKDVVIECDIYDANDVLILEAMILNIKNIVHIKVGFMAFQRQDKYKIINNGKLEEIPLYSSPLKIIDRAIGSRKITVSLLDMHNNLSDDFFEYQLNIIPDVEKIVDYGLKALLDRDIAASPDDVVLVYPDAGALSRYSKTNVNYKSVHFSKKRGDDGRIYEHKLDESYDDDVFVGKDVFVIDDLCDGGATFISISQKIKGAKTKTLYVTHGLFTNGTAYLKMSYDLIMYSTSPFLENDRTLEDCLKIEFNEDKENE